MALKEERNCAHCGNPFVEDDSLPLTWRERALIAEESVKRLEEQTNDLRTALEIVSALSQETKQSVEQLIRQVATRSFAPVTAESAVESWLGKPRLSKRQSWFGRK